MNVDVRKVMGYSMLCVGIILMIFAMYSAYLVFTNISKPPEVVRLSTLSVSLNTGQDRPPMQATVPLDEQVKKIANVFLYYLFMLLILSAGAKIAGLGIELARDKRSAANKE